MKLPRVTFEQLEADKMYLWEQPDGELVRVWANSDGDGIELWNDEMPEHEVSDSKFYGPIELDDGGE